MADGVAVGKEVVANGRNHAADNVIAKVQGAEFTGCWIEEMVIFGNDLRGILTGSVVFHIRLLAERRLGFRPYLIIGGLILFLGCDKIGPWAWKEG